MPACSINWCKKSSKTSNLQKDGITFHLFPRNFIQRRKWAQVCNRPKFWAPTYSSSICSRHFEDSQFQAVPNNRRVLIKNAMPTLLLHKHELDMANMRHKVPKREIIQKNNSDFITSSENEDLKTTIKTYECLQKYIKDLLPDIPDNEAIFVIIVNNEADKKKASAETNGRDTPPEINNDQEKEKLRALNIELRRKIAEKSKLAEERRIKIRALTQTKRRLLRRNASLTNIVVQLKTQSIVSQLRVDPTMGSMNALNGIIGSDFLGSYDDKSVLREYLESEDDKSVLREYLESEDDKSDLREYLGSEDDKNELREYLGLDENEEKL